MDYRDNRQRWAESHQVVHFYAGQWCTFTPALTQVTFRKKIYETIEQLQNELDQWIDHYNNERTNQGKICEGRTPMQTLEEGKAIWREKFVALTLTDAASIPAPIRSGLNYYT